ncbi:hypothetical protein D3C72_1844760 [compost metagenome]
MASILLTKELGNVISKAPKNDAAKTTSNKKNRKLNTPLVDKALSASEPKAIVIIIPSATYITMIKRPYNNALLMPLARVPDCLVK